MESVQFGPEFGDEERGPVAFGIGQRENGFVSDGFVLGGFCGCEEKLTPAVALAGGWRCTVKRLAAATLTLMFDEVALVKVPLLN